MQRHGVSPLIAFVFFVAIVVAAVGLALTIGLPQMQMIGETASVENSITALTELDRSIQEVATEGQYSSRTVSLRFQDGQYRFDPEREMFYYEIDTDSDIVSTHATRQLGPVQLSANTDVTVERETVNGVDCYMMKNQHLEACVRAIPETWDADSHPHLVGYWRMNEGDGDWANDSSRYGHHGTLENDPDWADGVHGDALVFDGEDSYVDVDYFPELDSDQFSVSFWVNLDSTGTNWRGIDYFSHDDHGWMVNVQDGDGDNALQFFSASDGDSETVFGEQALSPDTWYHVAASYDEGEVVMYIDGERDTAGTVTEFDPTDGSLDAWIGANQQGGNVADGTFDEFRIYNRSLTEDEVRWQYLQRGDLNYVNTSELLIHLHNKNEDETLNGTLHTYIDEDMGTRAGTGHVTTEQIGDQVGRGQVTANVTGDDGPYDVDYRLMSGADFLTVQAANDNVTAALDAVVDDPGDPVYIDGTQRAPGVYRDEDITFGYGVAEGSTLIAGLVAGTGFSHVGYETLSDRYRVNVTDTGSSTFLLPFSTGTHSDVQSREDLIRDGVYGTGRLFGYPSPNFAYTLTEEKTVRTALAYDTIRLTGVEQTLSPGTHDLRIENHGTEDGQVNVSISAQ